MPEGGLGGSYELNLPSFDGPLDLLLQLVERRQLDITTVSLAVVTDQYLERLRTGEGIDPEQLSEFVAVAAKLLLIKSVALLPQPARQRSDETSEDPTDLTERLREYEAIKRGAEQLRSREEADLRSFPHLPPSNVLGLARAAASAALLSETAALGAGGERSTERQKPTGLLAALRRVNRRRREEPVTVAREVWPVADALVWLVSEVRAGAERSFLRMIGSLGRGRVVGAFLALLELHRQGRVQVVQPEPFGEIEVVLRDEPLDEPGDEPRVDADNVEAVLAGAAAGS